jgi:hypothetical protein
MRTSPGTADKSIPIHASAPSSFPLMAQEPGEPSVDSDRRLSNQKLGGAGLPAARNDRHTFGPPTRSVRYAHRSLRRRTLETTESAQTSISNSRGAVTAAHVPMHPPSHPVSEPVADLPYRRRIAPASAPRPRPAH